MNTKLAALVCTGHQSPVANVQGGDKKGYKVLWRIAKESQGKGSPLKRGEAHAGVYTLALLNGTHAGARTCTTNI